MIRSRRDVFQATEQGTGHPSGRPSSAQAFAVCAILKRIASSQVNDMKKPLSFLFAVAFLIAFGLTLQPATRAGEGPDASSKRASAVTFSRDVAPILYKNCVVCHRPNDLAPMSLISYKEARPWARSIKEKVVSREMPPWQAD